VRALTREQVLAFRAHAQQLGRDTGTVADTAVLDLGVQDTGTDGGPWALALRGVTEVPEADLALAWTLRGAPHLYRRADLPGVLTATAPFSDADAGKRIYDAAKPLRAAGIPIVEALDVVAGEMRDLVRQPMGKGDVSGALNARLPEPYLRFCRPCNAVHLYEQPFRLAALRAGLELEPGTSPPVLRPVPGLAPIPQVPARLDVVRGYLRLLGPATPAHVAGYLDAPTTDVRAHWPDDAVEVSVGGERWWTTPPAGSRSTRRHRTASGCSGPSISSCRPRTASCSLLTRRTARRSGRCWAGRAPCSPAPRSRARGGHGSPAPGSPSRRRSGRPSGGRS
jgi:hypothetical protein